MMPPEDTNVEFEKTKLNGRLVRATGGTCALMGRLMLGAACTTSIKANNEARRSIVKGLGAQIRNMLDSMRLQLP